MGNQAQDEEKESAAVLLEGLPPVLAKIGNVATAANGLSAELLCLLREWIRQAPRPPERLKFNTREIAVILIAVEPEECASLLLTGILGHGTHIEVEEPVVISVKGK